MQEEALCRPGHLLMLGLPTKSVAGSSGFQLQGTQHSRNPDHAPGTDRNDVIRPGLSVEALRC